MVGQMARVYMGSPLYDLVHPCVVLSDRRDTQRQRQTRRVTFQLYQVAEGIGRTLFS